MQGAKLIDEESNTSNSSKPSSNFISHVNKQEEINGSLNVADESSQIEREDNVKQLVSDCRKLLVDGNEDCFVSWALINVNECDF